VAVASDGAITEGWTERLANLTYKVSGLNHITDFERTLSATLIEDKILEAAERVSAGEALEKSLRTDLAVLGLDRAAGVLIILILGGYGRLYGAVIGAVAYMVLEDQLAKAYPSTWQLGIGVTLVMVALYAPNGILGIAESLRRRLSAKGAP
jgi:hypothetical protein